MRATVMRILGRIVTFIFGVSGIALFLIALVSFNDWIDATIPGFEFWTAPLIVGGVTFAIADFIWQKTKESERLKYEFITVAAHKLRTPLTRIRWVIPELIAGAGDNQKLHEGIRRVDDANNRLIELTNVLMEAAHPGDGTYDYQEIEVDLKHLALEALKRFATQISEKKLQTAITPGDETKAIGDARRLALVTEVLIENAIMYTPQGGAITISIAPEGHRIRFAVTDTGIGVAAEDRTHIFSSFFRTGAARTADTEGVGLGLSLAKSIIERQHGHIGVESPGENKGSTFWYSVPKART